MIIQNKFSVWRRTVFNAGLISGFFTVFTNADVAKTTTAASPSPTLSNEKSELNSASAEIQPTAPQEELMPIIRQASLGNEWVRLPMEMEKFEFQIIRLLPKEEPISKDDFYSRERTRYVASWRSECFYFAAYEGDAAKNLQAKPTSIVARLKGNVWRWEAGVLERCQMNFNDLPEYYPLPFSKGTESTNLAVNQKAVRAIPNRPLEDLEFAGRMIEKALRLGFNMLGPKSVSWNGNSFTAKNLDRRDMVGRVVWKDDSSDYTAENLDRIRFYYQDSIQFSPDSGRYMQGFHLLFRFHNKTWTPRYWPENFPSTVSLYSDPDSLSNSPVMVEEVRFENWVPALTTVPYSRFDAEQLKGETEKYWYVTENSAAFRDKAGRLKSIEDFYPQIAQHNFWQDKRNLILLIALIAIVGAAIFWAWRKLSFRQNTGSLPIYWIASVILCIFGSTFKAQAQISDQQLQTVDWYRNLLENPPKVVKNFAFEIISPQPAFPGFKPEVQTNWFFLRWQPNGILSHALQSADWKERLMLGPLDPDEVREKLAPNEALYGWFDGVFWSYRSSGYLSLNTNQTELEGLKTPDGILRVASDFMDKDYPDNQANWDWMPDYKFGLETLQLGLYSPQVSTLKWDFSLFNGLAKNGENIFGSIIVDSNNLLEKIVFRYPKSEKLNTTQNIEFQYSENTNLPPRFPSSFRLYYDLKSHSSAAQLTRRIYNIHHLEIEDQEVDDSYYDFRRLTNSVVQTSFYTGKDYSIEVFEDGREQIMPLPKNEPPRKNYTVLILSAIGAFSVFIWIRLKNKN